MHSTYFLLALTAACSHAFFFQAVPAKAPRRSLVGRNMEYIARGHVDPLFAHGCPSGGNKALPDSVAHRTLSMEDIATAQNAIMEWCDKGNDLDPSAGDVGHVEKSGGVAAQICNLGTSPIKCNSSYVEDMFKAIPCGSSDKPTMGIAAPTIFEESVAYAPADKLPPCAGADDTKHAMGLGDGPLFSGGSCDNGMWC